MRYVLGKVENTMGKGENAGYQHFLFFSKCFQTGPLFIEISFNAKLEKPSLCIF